MRKVLVIAVIALLVLLVACGKTQTAKPLKLPSEPVSAPAMETPSSEPVVEDEGTGMTAAEAIKDLQVTVPKPSTTTGKVASTGLPPAPAGVTGVDALKARTKALYSQGSPVTGAVAADTRTGSIADDLPSEYDNDGSAGE
jgi:predicted small lipoprotein YifL